MTRRFIQPCERKDDAWTLAHEFAADLRRRGLTSTHRIAVEQHGRWWWIVLTIDDTTEETPCD